MSYAKQLLENQDKPKTHRFEHALVSFISDTIPQREVDRVVPSLSESNIFDISSPGEEFTVLVERTGHDSIGRVEGFFNSISMVNIDVDVEDSRVIT